MNQRTQQWVIIGSCVIAAPFLFLIGVALMSAHQQTAPSPPVVTTPPPVPAPVPVPAAAEVQVAPAPDPDEALTANAQRIAALVGEPLIEELWAMDQRAQPPPRFALLERSPDRFNGYRTVIEGEVLEIHDVPNEAGAFMRVELDDDSSHVIAVMTLAQPPDDVTRGRRVRVYGVLFGQYTYESQAGWTITIPRMGAAAVVRSSVPRRAPRT